MSLSQHTCPSVEHRDQYWLHPPPHYPGVPCPATRTQQKINCFHIHVLQYEILHEKKIKVQYKYLKLKQFIPTIINQNETMSIKQHPITILTAKSYFLTSPTQKFFGLQYSFSTIFTRIGTICTSITFETRYGRVLLTFIFSVFSFIFSLVAVRSWFILRISLFIIWKRTTKTFVDMCIN